MNGILTYHSIDASGSPVSVAPDTFARHLRWLTSDAVQAVPLDDLVEGRAGTNSVSVTFDDGFLSCAPAIERLLDAGIVPTIFAVTGHAGATNAWGGRDQKGIPTLPLMSWADLERLVIRGARVEAHTRTHPHCTHLAQPQLTDEILGSRDDIERRLGRRPRHFAYPYGDINDAVVHCARSAFPYAHTTEMRALDGGDPARLPRLDMYYFQADDSLDAFGSPAFARRLAWIRARRAVKARVFG